MNTAKNPLSLAQAFARAMTYAQAPAKSIPFNQLISRLESYLPYGAGFDFGTIFDKDESTVNKLVFHAGYHHMNDVGYYIGWSQNKIIVTPGFEGLDLRLVVRYCPSGVDSGSHREDMLEIFGIVLEQPIDYDSLWAQCGFIKRA